MRYVASRLLHVEAEAFSKVLTTFFGHLPKPDHHFPWYQQRLPELDGDVDRSCDDFNA